MPLVPLLCAAALLGAEPPVPLTLDEAKAVAYRSNRDFLDARSAVLRARLGIIAARSDLYAPRLDFSYTASSAAQEKADAEAGIAIKTLGFDIRPYVSLDHAPQGGTTAAGGPGPEAISAVGVTLSRKLLNISEHLRQRLPVDRADQALFAAANTLVIRARRLEADLARAFLAVQKADARLAVREARVRDAEEFLRVERERVDRGFAAPLDGLNAEVDYNQALLDRNTERTNASLVRQELNDALGRSLTQALDIVPLDVPALVAALGEPPIEEDAARLLAGSEELGTQAKEVELAIQDVRIARDQLVPQVTATFKASSQTTADAPFSAGVTDEQVASLTVAWTMPLDGFSAERARALQTEESLTSLLRQQTKLRADLERRLRGLHQQIVQARASLALGERRLEVERARLEALKRKYEANLVDSVEVTRGKQALDNAELGLLDARMGLYLLDADYRALLPLRPTLLDAP